MDIVSVDAVL